MATLSRNLTVALHSKTNKDTRSRHNNLPFNARTEKKIGKCVMKEMI
jgi:hypothetical protein